MADLKWSDLSSSRFLNGGDVAGQPNRVVTIARIGLESMPDGSQKACVFFNEITKGVVLNKTRRSFLEQLCKSPRVNDAVGMQIQLGAGTANFQGADRPTVKFSMTPADAKKRVADELDDEISL